MSSFIYAKSQFEAFHRWKDAPEDVEFLRSFHRHIFHVKVTFEVQHNNRNIEFFQFKRKLDFFLGGYTGRSFEFSCEQLAEQVLVHFRAHSVEVSEDGENGAVVFSSRKSAVAEAERTWPFLGVELEGPCVGSRVLFLPSTLDLRTFQLAVERLNTPTHMRMVQRVYLGAGNCRVVTGEEAVVQAAFRCAVELGALLDIETQSVVVACDILNRLDDSQIDRLGYVIALTRFSGDNADSHLRPDRRNAKHLILKWIENDTVFWKSMTTGNVWETWLYHPGFDQDEDV